MSLGELIKYLYSDILSSLFTEIFVVVYWFLRQNIYDAAYLFLSRTLIQSTVNHLPWNIQKNPSIFLKNL